MQLHAKVYVSRGDINVAEHDAERDEAPGAAETNLPEADDQVLVAFEHGDLRSPYSVGWLWNSTDKPPTEKR